MNNYKEVPMDPNIMDRVKSKRSLKDLHEEASLVKNLNPKNWDRVDEVTKDILELYFVNGKKQTDLAIIFGCNQSNIHHTLKRGLKVIRYLDGAPDEPSNFYEELREAIEIQSYHQNTPILKRLEIIKDYLITLNQSKTGYYFDLTQIQVRTILQSALNALKLNLNKESYEYLKYYTTNVPTLNYYKRSLDPDSRVKGYNAEVLKRRG